MTGVCDVDLLSDHDCFESSDADASSDDDDFSVHETVSRKPSVKRSQKRGKPVPSRPSSLFKTVTISVAAHYHIHSKRGYVDDVGIIFENVV